MFKESIKYTLEWKIKESKKRCKKQHLEFSYEMFINKGFKE